MAVRSGVLSLLLLQLLKCGLMTANSFENYSHSGEHVVHHRTIVKTHRYILTTVNNTTESVVYYQSTKTIEGPTSTSAHVQVTAHLLDIFKMLHARTNKTTRKFVLRKVTKHSSQGSWPKLNENEIWYESARAPTEQLGSSTSFHHETRVNEVNQDENVLEQTGKQDHHDSKGESEHSRHQIHHKNLIVEPNTHNPPSFDRPIHKPPRFNDKSVHRQIDLKNQQPIDHYPVENNSKPAHNKPVIKDDKSIQEPIIKDDKSIQEPVIEYDKFIQDHVIKDDKSIQEHVIKDDKSIQEHVIKDNKSIQEPVIKDDKSIQEPVIKDDKSIQEPVIKDDKYIQASDINEDKSIQEPDMIDNKTVTKQLISDNKPAYQQPSINEPIFYESVIRNNKSVHQQPSIDDSISDHQEHVINDNKPVPQEPSIDDNISVPQKPVINDNKLVLQEAVINDNKSVPQEPVINDNKSAPQEHVINDNRSVPQKPVINDIKSAPQEHVINDNKSVPQKPVINDNKSVLQDPVMNDNKSVPQKPVINDNKSVPQERVIKDNRSVPQKPVINDNKSVPQEPVINDNKSVIQGPVINDDKFAHQGPSSSDHKVVQQHLLNNGTSPMKHHLVTGTFDMPNESHIESNTSYKELSLASRDQSASPARADIFETILQQPSGEQVSATLNASYHYRNETSVILAAPDAHQAISKNRTHPPINNRRNNTLEANNHTISKFSNMTNLSSQYTAENVTIISHLKMNNSELYREQKYTHTQSHHIVLGAHIPMKNASEKVAENNSGTPYDEKNQGDEDRFETEHMEETGVHDLDNRTSTGVDDPSGDDNNERFEKSESSEREIHTLITGFSAVPQKEGDDNLVTTNYSKEISAKQNESSELSTEPNDRNITNERLVTDNETLATTSTRQSVNENTTQENITKTVNIRVSPTGDQIQTNTNVSMEKTENKMNLNKTHHSHATRKENISPSQTIEGLENNISKKDDENGIYKKIGNKNSEISANTLNRRNEAEKSNEAAMNIVRTRTNKHYQERLLLQLANLGWTGIIKNSIAKNEHNSTETNLTTPVSIEHNFHQSSTMKNLNDRTEITHSDKDNMSESVQDQKVREITPMKIGEEKSTFENKKITTQKRDENNQSQVATYPRQTDAIKNTAELLLGIATLGSSSTSKQWVHINDKELAITEEIPDVEHLSNESDSMANETTTVSNNTGDIEAATLMPSITDSSTQAITNTTKLQKSKPEQFKPEQSPIRLDFPAAKRNPISPTTAPTIGYHNDTGAGQVDDQVTCGSTEADWSVLVSSPNDTSVICSGSLIDSHLVLTSARCIQSMDDNSTWVHLSNGRHVPVIRQSTHQLFPSDNSGYDLTVLLMQHPVSSAPICLPEDTLDEDTPMVAVGWTQREPHGFVATPLDHLPFDKCRETLSMYGGYRRNFGSRGLERSRHLCTGKEQTVAGDCPDYLGSQLVTRTGDGRWQLKAQLQQSVMGSCGYRNMPDVYHNISNHLPWLHKTMLTLTNQLNESRT